VTDECVTTLNEIEGEPIHVESCEGVMQSVVDEPGGAECVSICSSAALCQQYSQ
jgi:hypothetical protein